MVMIILIFMEFYKKKIWVKFLIFLMIIFVRFVNIFINKIFVFVILRIILKMFFYNKGICFE